MLKQLFPTALRATNSSNLIKAIIFYLVIGIIGGIVCKIIGIIPIIGWLVAALLGLVIGLYVLIGLVLSVLTYIAVTK